MRAKKILNNNVVLTIDDSGKELVVMGKGLCYGLKTGDYISDYKIEKVFSLRTKEEASRFAKLMEEIPIECLEISEKIVNHAIEVLGKKLHNSIYITLTDHINTMIERAKLGAYIQNSMLWDIKHLYRNEFVEAQHAIELINETFKSKYDDNEAATIALHFVNAELEMDFSQTINITKVVTEILGIVKYNLRIVYDEDSLAYYRFVVHLRFFSQRLVLGNTYDNSGDPELLDHIKIRYADSFECAQLVKKFVQEKYGYFFQDEELLYLTIHIQNVLKG